MLACISLWYLTSLHLMMTILGFLELAPLLISLRPWHWPSSNFLWLWLPHYLPMFLSLLFWKVSYTFQLFHSPPKEEQYPTWITAKSHEVSQLADFKQLKKDVNIHSCQSIDFSTFWYILQIWWVQFSSPHRLQLQICNFWISVHLPFENFVWKN